METGMSPNSRSARSGDLADKVKIHGVFAHHSRILEQSQLGGWTCCIWCHLSSPWIQLGVFLWSLPNMIATNAEPSLGLAVTATDHTLQDALNLSNFGLLSNGLNHEQQNIVPAAGFSRSATSNSATLVSTAPNSTPPTLTYGVLSSEANQPSSSPTSRLQARNSRLPCPRAGCNATFGRSYELNRHERTVHLSEGQFWRTVAGCKRTEHSGGKPFTRLDKYKEHARKVHGMAA